MHQDEPAWTPRRRAALHTLRRPIARHSALRVAQDTSTNLLAANITKYWKLFDKLTPEAAKNVAYQNA